MTDPVTEHILAALRMLRQANDRPECAAALELALTLAKPGTHFGELLAQRRAQAGLSVAKLALRAGLAENTLRNHEADQGVPTRDSLARLLAVPELMLGVIEHAPPAPLPPMQPNSYLPPRYDPSALAQELRAVVNGPGGTLEQSHLYLDNQSAADYLAVCEAYGSTRGAQFAALQAVADKIAGLGPSDVIAIGSGDGRAEAHLCRALVEHGGFERLYLLDLSHTLLTRAYEHASLVLRPAVDVKAVHGNFHELQHYPMLHASAGGARRLYTMLGATIANLDDELRFFRDLHRRAAAGDLLLIDYQLAHAPPESDPTLRPGAIPKLFFDWHAGPLKRNNPAVRGVVMRPQLLPGRMTGSYVIGSMADVTMDDGSQRSYQVMSSARYTPEALSAALAGAGWQTLHAAPYDSRTALMLLQRT